MFGGWKWSLEFVQAIQTFLIDKANLGSPTKKGRKDKPHVIPYCRFMKLIICHLGRTYNIHQRSASPFHLAEEDLRLGNLKFAPKGKEDEVFEMPIPNELISNNIRNAPYYDAYLEIVAKLDRKIATEHGGKKKPATAKQPKLKPAKENSSKPAPTLKPKVTKEKPSKPSPAKHPKREKLPEIDEASWIRPWYTAKVQTNIAEESNTAEDLRLPDRIKDCKKDKRRVKDISRLCSGHSPVSTADSPNNITNLSDATIYAFLANQPNGSRLVHEDLEQIHEDDLEEMDLKMRHSRRTMNVEETSSKAMVVINGAGFDWSFMADEEVPTNMALMAFSDSKLYNDITCLFAPPTIYLSNSGLEEFQQPEFEGYRPKANKSVCKDTSNEVKKTPDAPLGEKLVSEKEKQTVFPTKIESVKQQEKPARKPVKLTAITIKEKGWPNTAVVIVVRANQVNVVKASECWVWRPTKLNRHPQKEDQGYVESGCSRHMTGNMSYLSDFKEFDGE
ncbi:hypothetical protein Tco_1125404 [Tanacetum coccineum]|uniref:Histone deacetylase 14 n=1 Tax=Tanacetum coccineum TaxID=301880 RepID=A0ABQ5J9F1_9ASTR